MKIYANWKKPLKLMKGSRYQLLYFIDTNNLPESSGCYVFYNKHGNKITPLYIGKAENLRRRIDQQLNNLKLMFGIQKSLAGKKYMMYCEVPGNKKKKILKKKLAMLERQLIKHVTLRGFELLNQIGTKTKYHQITFNGNRESENIFGRKMNINV